MIESGVRPDFVIRKAGRLGCGVRVKSRTLDVAPARPESGAADFVRIGFARDGIRAGALGSATSGEARHRVIEAAPEEMDRAGLADEECSELLQYRVHPRQDAPEAMCSLGMI